MADIPGIIEGAHEGKGLGVRFLRHIERNSILLFLVPADSTDIIKDYQVLVNELKQFNPDLLDKQRVLGVSKIDLLDDELLKLIKKDISKRFKEKVPVVYFSSHTEHGIKAMKDVLWDQIHQP